MKMSTLTANGENGESPTVGYETSSLEGPEYFTIDVYAALSGDLLVSVQSKPSDTI